MGSLVVNGIARITRDAEARKSATGTWYSFGIAAFRRNAKEGKQSADFFEADLFMKNEILGFDKKLSKGKVIYIENAYLRNDQFKGQDGKEKNKQKLMINSFEILGDKSEPAMPEEKQPITSKSKYNTTAPSDLPPPTTCDKKTDLDPAGKKYFKDLAKKDSTEQKKSEEVYVETEEQEDYTDEVPF